MSKVSTPLSPAESRSFDATATNRRYWDGLAEVHGNGVDAYYDVEGLLAGRGAMTEIEQEALATAGGVAGKDVLHVQCHIGFDAITFAQRGARVTGVDFSPIALAKAAQLAARAGVSVSWLEANSLGLPAELARRFDLAYASIGAICWIGDLRRWMEQVAGTLRAAGGRLVLVDLHPAYGMVDRQEPLEVTFPYAYDGPRAYRTGASYAGPALAAEAGVSVQYAHDLGEVVNAAIAAGLRIEALREHLSCAFDPRGGVAIREADGRYRFRLGGAHGFPLPMLFTLVASLA
jgi:SAM-dependent methyltransferase